MADANFIIRSTHYTPLRRDSVIAVVIQTRCFECKLFHILEIGIIRKLKFSIRSILVATAVVALVTVLLANWQSVYCRLTIGPAVGGNNVKWLGQSRATIYVSINGTVHSTESSDAAWAYWQTLQSDSTEELRRPRICGAWKHSGEEILYTLKIENEFVKTID